MRDFDSQHEKLSLVCEKSSKVLDLSMVRGKGRPPESNVTKSARFLLVENACLLPTFHYDLEKGGSRSPITA